MRRAALLLGLALTVAACGRGQTAVPFDGIYFRANAKAVERSARETFVVTVRRASRSEEGARQAAAHEATRYCIRWFGRSDIEWAVAPDDPANGIEDDRLTARGTCTG